MSESEGSGEFGDVGVNSVPLGGPSAPGSSGGSGDRVNIEGASQAVEDQVAVIQSVCAHMDRIMVNFTPGAIAGMPKEAQRAVQEMKSKMVLFVSNSDGSKPAKAEGSCR